MFTPLWDLLFPKRCVHCRRWDDLLCSDCWGEIEFLTRQVCPACHQPSVLGLASHGCNRRTYLDQLYSVCHFSGPIRSLVTRFKFIPPVRQVEHVIAELLERTLVTEDIGVWSGALVTAVPLHIYRHKERGFNQSEEIAKLLAQNLGLSFDFSILNKPRPTPQQSRLAKKLRRKNTRGVFNVQPAWVGQSIEQLIIVDDVYTTGSTLQECARILKQGSVVQKVFGFTLARG